MADHDIADFVTSARGEEFFTAYDSLLARWPGTQSVDIRTEYGLTRVNICGPETGTAALLLPGWGATSMVFTANVGALAAAGYRPIALDYPGDAGRSVASPRRPQSTDELLDWLAIVLTGLGLDKEHVVAHSYGAMVALAFALSRHRDRVDGLVLLEPTSCFAGLRARYLIRALPTLVGGTPTRQRRFLEWETESSELTSSDVGRESLALACAAAAFPTRRPAIPRRPHSTSLALLDDHRTTVILAPRSKAHNAASIANRITVELPGAHVLTMSSGTHHSFPIAAADELNDALLSAIDAKFGGL